MKMTVKRGSCTRALLLPIALVLLGESPAPPLYLYDTDLQPLMVGDKPDYNARMVPKDNPPIPPVKFGQWLISSEWAKQLAARWAELPFVFDSTGPEYCSALGVDKDRMLHVSTPVRYRDAKKAATSCPKLVWTGDAFMFALSSGTHSHPTPQSHGERISVDDAALGGPLLVGADAQARVEMLRVAVNLFSGERLMGVAPTTGKEAPVPAQSLFFTRFDGAVHVFLWMPLSAGTKDRAPFVRVYRPAPNDGWEEAGTCWGDARDVRQAEAFHSTAPVRCNPNDFWLK